MEAPESEPTLFKGKMVAGPILLALATEVALKAWQCMERNGGAPDRTHDLLKLFDKLSPATRDRLEARMPELPDPLGMHEFDPFGAGMRKTLRFNREMFQLWRYPYESSGLQFYSSILDTALTEIIDAFDEAFAEMLLELRSQPVVSGNTQSQ